MNWATRTGYRLLFWIAECLLNAELSEDQREALHAIIISFNNESMPPLER